MINDAFDYDAAAANLKRRFEERRLKRRELHAQACADCTSIVDMIARTYAPRRIYQWGSLLHPDKFDENSDIDIAVEGIDDAKTWFELTTAAMRMTTFSLDIVQMEHVNPLDRASIVENGKLVYERQ